MKTIQKFIAWLFVGVAFTFIYVNTRVYVDLDTMIGPTGIYWNWNDFVVMMLWISSASSALLIVLTKESKKKRKSKTG